MKHTAIVLKRLYPHYYKAALFDAVVGRIDVLYHKALLIPGSLIEYYSEAAEIKRIQDVELLYVPLEWGKNDLLFTHHVLELCYYFMPLHSRSAEIFEMLILLFRSEYHPWTPWLKKLFVAKLLILFSVYPKTSFVMTPLFKKLLYGTAENLLTLDREGNDMAYIDQWVKQTISEHPMVALFKTTIFLTESR